MCKFAQKADRMPTKVRVKNGTKKETTVHKKLRSSRIHEGILTKTMSKTMSFKQKLLLCTAYHQHNTQHIAKSTSSIACAEYTKL